jgi:hypothetical protein
LRVTVLQGALLPALLPALCLGLLAGCAGGGDPERPSGHGLPSEADMRTYFEAIASGDPARTKEAEAIAVPGSPAQGYAAFLGLAATAAQAAAQDTQSSQKVKDVDGGFQACVEKDACVDWTDLEGKGGKLTDFAVNDVPLDDLLVDMTGQQSISSSGLYDVQPEYAFLLPDSGILNVVVTIKAAEAALSAKPGTYIEGSKVLEGTQTAGQGLIRPGASSPVMFAFPKAQNVKLDGQVTFELKIGGAGSDSIGFGLADPAAS